MNAQSGGFRRAAGLARLRADLLPSPARSLKTFTVKDAFKVHADQAHGLIADFDAEEGQQDRA